MMQRDSQVKDMLFGETFQQNKSMIYTMQEINKSTLQCIQSITSMMAPLLDAKERENRKLKRILSERHGIETEEDIL